jgi:hypothetical protein
MNSPAPDRTRLVWTTQAAICAAGAALRVWAIHYGLPGVYNPDEIPILNRALALGSNHLNPHNFLYPSLYFYALFVWEGLFFVVGRLAGWFQSLAAFQGAFFIDVSPFITSGRLLTAAFGTLTIPVTYRFASTLYGRAAGLVAAVFLAAAPFAVRDAHYIKHDVPAAFFCALTLMAMAPIVVDPARARTTRAWLIAGACAGLAMSTHYYTILIVAPIIAASITEASRVGGPKRAFTLLVWAGVASTIAFFAATPFILIEPQTAVRDIVAVRQIDVDRAVTGTHAFGSLVPYLRMLAGDAIGWPVALIGAIGVVWAVVSDRHRGWLVASFPIAFLAFLANTVPMNRYVNAMLPSMAVAAAFVVVRVAAWAGARPGPSGVQGRVGAATVLALLAVVPGAVGSVRSDEFYAQPDTRALATTYIEREVPSNASVLIQPYSVALRRTDASLSEALRAHLGTDARASTKFQLMLAAPDRAPAYRTIYLGDGGVDPDKIYVSPRAFDREPDLAPLRRLQVEYVVLKQYNTANLALASFEAALHREGRLVATFSPYRANVDAVRRAAVPPFLHNVDARIDPALERPGPTIEIWRITP